MSDEPKVSVVMPVYNTAPYLRQCLDSVVNQTLADIEIICVDDGSADGSLAILEEYAAADPRMHILRQQNQYAGVARNNGMAIARGKYLMFWDSDDYFDLTALEKMYNQCEADEADICVCGGKRFYEESQIEIETNAYLVPKRIPDRLPFNRFTNAENLISFTTVMIWNKLYRRSFVEGHHLEFQKVRNGNDVFFSAAALCLADRITVVQEHLVTYRIGRADSLVSTLDESPCAPLQGWIDAYEAYGGIEAFPRQSYAKKVVGVIRHCFRNIKTWDGYSTCYRFLKDEGLERLTIVQQPEGYYLEWMDEFLAHLINDGESEFLAYLSFSGYRALERESAAKVAKQAECKELRRRLRASEKACKAASTQLDGIKRSRSYRFARLLSMPMRFFRTKS